jgi:cytochrome c6
MVTKARVEMSLNNKVAAAFFAGAMAFAPAVYAADLEAGAQVFAGNCAACHAGGNNVIQNEKTLRKEALEAYLDGGLKEASIMTQVTNGKNAMPAFGGRLDEDEIKNVAAYVFDQATGAKWD